MSTNLAAIAKSLFSAFSAEAAFHCPTISADGYIRQAHTIDNEMKVI